MADWVWEMHHVLGSDDRSADQQLADLWEKGTFVIDTNVLLNLYRFKLQARQDLLDVLDAMRDQTWIPYQVALEFERRRSDVVGVGNRSFLGKLEMQGTDQPEAHQHDEIRDFVAKLLAGRTGPAPTKETLEKICGSGVERYLAGQPPGLKDAHKQQTYSHGGLLYYAKFGDLLVWLQTLDHARTSGLKHLIFITDDKKKDWWHLSKGKVLGPRPELVEEAKRVANVDHFHMYLSDQLLELAGQHLQAEISPNWSRT